MIHAVDDARRSCAFLSWCGHSARQNHPQGRLDAISLLQLNPAIAADVGGEICQGPQVGHPGSARLCGHGLWRCVSRFTTGSLVPRIRLSGGYMTALTGVLGTTISPYLFFWQASQEVEEQKAAPGEKPLRRAPRQAAAQLEAMRADTYLGMAVSNVIAYFIVLDTGALLHAHGTMQIETATQAAEALRPLGGECAFLLFGIGIIGTGLLAVPVLAASVGYALAEVGSWPRGLSKRSEGAPAFYGSIGAVALLINLLRVSPIKALCWSAVVNGVSAGPIMIIVMLMTTNRKIMGSLQFPRTQWILGWISTAVMLTLAAGMSPIS
jgi:Mn2+/Fe2+ NRAMP family transporter